MARCGRGWIRQGRTRSNGVVERKASMGSSALEEKVFPCLALFCDPEGALIELIHDDWRLFDSVQPGARFTDLVDSGSCEKAERFLALATGQGAAFDWELIVCAGDTTAKLHFGGCKTEKGALVIGSSSRSGLCRTFAQVATKRGLAMGGVSDSVQAEDALYNELSRLNNELVNAHRDLAKKNAELEESRVQLERRVQERTQGLNNALSRLQSEIEIRTEAEERM